MKKLHVPLVLGVCCVFLSNTRLVNAQPYISLDNYTGGWEMDASWVGNSSPSLSFNLDMAVTVFGEISTSTSLDFNKGELVINDTLVVRGDLSFGNFGNLIVSAGGVLIVSGSLNVGDKVDIEAGGTVIVAGDVNFLGASNQGSFTSDQFPAQVYIGGAITGSPPISSVLPSIPVISCDAAIEHPNTQCNYGDLTDLETEDGNQDIFVYYQEVICGGGVDPGSIGFDQTICTGNAGEVLTEILPSPEGVFQWFLSLNSTDPGVPTWEAVDGATQTSYDPGVLTQTTSYYRQAQMGVGCIANSNVVTITVVNAPSPSGIYHD